MSSTLSFEVTPGWIPCQHGGVQTGFLSQSIIQPGGFGVAVGIGALAADTHADRADEIARIISDLRINVTTNLDSSDLVIVIPRHTTISKHL